jgi:hypothetical protein
LRLAANRRAQALAYRPARISRLASALHESQQVTAPRQTRFD